MKQSEIIKAYKTMESLASNNELSQDEQWDIYQLRKTLRPHFEFQVEREDAIREKYLPFANEDGALSEEESQKYLKELTDLGNMDINMPEIIKPKIRFVKGISFITAEQLEDFIEFTRC